MKSWKLKDWMLLAASIIICQAAGFIGSFFTITGDRSWYAGLVRPSIAPPNWVFGPVWITLYFLMGISLFLVLRKGLKKTENKVAVGLFGGQLVLNSLWSILFFGIQSPSMAFIEIIILWLMILASMIAFYKIRKEAMYLLIPYILWVSFAALLNYQFMMLN
ncbi:TPA: tryptophan-rich sensory protein [Candidatus Woesearchaeota archaeon]|nr:tryptophan-rich sensory protein [Candidatus Woesearchaeota archaeon]